MKTEIRKLVDLYHDPANVRMHGEHNLAAIKASLQRFGQQEPIIITEDGMVVAGNGRLTVALELGWKEMEVVVTDLDALNRTAYSITSNRTAELASWDTDALRATLEALAAEDDMDIMDIGFDPEQLSQTLKAIEEAEAIVSAAAYPAVAIIEDEAPEPLAEAATRMGDLWLCGTASDADSGDSEHRVLCGDALDLEAVQAVMSASDSSDSLADLLLIDPPYNVAYVGRTAKKLTIQNDSQSPDDFLAFLTGALTTSAVHMRPGAGFYVWRPDAEVLNFHKALAASGLSRRQTLIWVKSTFALGRQDYHYQHEGCYYGWKEGAAHSWYSDRKQTTTLFFDKPNRNEEHPTMKPVALIAYQMGNSSKPDDVVLDSFLGSGTTLIAAEQLGRRCYAIELEPRYVDVAVRRWQNLTKRDAILDGDGRTFDEVYTERIGHAPPPPSSL